MGFGRMPQRKIQFFCLMKISYIRFYFILLFFLYTGKLSDAKAPCKVSFSKIAFKFYFFQCETRNGFFRAPNDSGKFSSARRRRKKIHKQFNFRVYFIVNEFPHKSFRIPLGKQLFREAENCSYCTL